MFSKTKKEKENKFDNKIIVFYFLFLKTENIVF